MHTHTRAANMKLIDLKLYLGYVPKLIPRERVTANYHCYTVCQQEGWNI